MRLGTKSVPAHGFASFTGARPRRQAEAVDAGDARTSTRCASASRSRGRKLVGYRVDSGIRSIKVVDGRCCSTASASRCAASGLHEDDPATGFAITPRAPRPDRRAGQGGRRDGHPRALPAAPRHPGSRRPRRPADLVGDPGLRGQDAVPQARAGAQARRQGAAAEHPRQPEPPVDHAVVDRQRAVRAARAGAGRSTSPRAVRDAKALDPDAAGRPGDRRLPVGGLPPAVRGPRRHRRQRVLRLVSGAQRPDRRPRHDVRLPRLASAPATRRRRSSSRSSAPRPTATGPSRRRAPTPTSRTS